MKTHGLSKHPLYHKHRAMLSRCYNKYDVSYKNYGDRGIRVCKEWKNSVKSFFDWAEPLYSKGLWLDRKDKNGDFTPDNCQFVTAKENKMNRRPQVKLVYRRIRYKGVYPSGKKGFCARIQSEDWPLLGKRLYIGNFISAEYALAARNAYIRKHNLRNKIQVYKGEFEDIRRQQRRTYKGR